MVKDVRSGSPGALVFYYARRKAICYGAPGWAVVSMGMYCVRITVRGHMVTGQIQGELFLMLRANVQVLEYFLVRETVMERPVPPAG